MTVAKFVQPNYNTQSGTTYPLGIDAAFAVAARLFDAFAPRALDTPAMKVHLDAGFIFNGTTLTAVAAQDTGTITAPSSNPRIDRVVVDELTGVVSVVTGAENASPVAPAITEGKIPVAQVLLQTSSATIQNSMITDERTGVWHQGGDVKGSDVASGSTLTLPAVGEYFNLTGTGVATAISARPAGRIILFRATSTAGFTHNATSLILKDGSSITMAVGDLIAFVSEGSGNWREINYWAALTTASALPDWVLFNQGIT